MVDLTKSTAVHGTRSRYQMGCDCQACSDANSDYARTYWQRNKKRLKLLRSAGKDQDKQSGRDALTEERETAV